MLCIDHLTTGYGNHPIGHNLCANLQRGRLTALLGPNGAGKSTLLRTLAGFQPPLSPPAEGADQHSILRINNKDLASYTPRELARTLSVVLTYRPEADALTAGEVVEMGRIPYARMLATQSDEDQKAVKRALQLTRTESFIKRPLHTLSDGERQRIFIAKALAQAPPVILLDEPTAFLDFPSKVAILRLLSHLAHKEEKTILLSTHDVELALQFADTLWLLRADGITEGSPEFLAQNGEMARFFGHEGISFDATTMRFIYHKQ